jgi:hypothetical protein
MHGRDEKCIQNFSQKLEKKRPDGRLGVDGIVTLELILR